LSLVLLIGLGTELLRSQSRGKQELLERFLIRSQVGSQFMTSYVSDLQSRQRNEAIAQFRSASVSERRFRRLAQPLGFSAAVLLDAQGHVLAIDPPDPYLLGQEIGSQYVYLRAAMQGRTSVSDVVSSAADGVPVVAFAVPFSTPFGRRVFSGGLYPADTTLGTAYLKNVLPLPGARVYLVDKTGATIASSLPGQQTADGMQSRDHSLSVAIASGQQGQYQGRDGVRRFASAAVAGTPWRIVLSAPEAALLAPVLGPGRWIPRLVLAALFLALTVMVGLFRQLGRTRAAQLADLERLSVTDALTGLYNRRGLELLASQALRSGARDGTMIPVLMLDVDDLKRVNDDQGHDAGDDVLRRAADLLRRTFRESDVIARLGGDEFCVVGAVPGLPADRETLLSRLKANMARDNDALGEEPHLSLSVGICWFDPQNPRPLEELQIQADEQMYEDKRSKRERPMSNASRETPFDLAS
jgi:diguanylate cyclase (GGDEF)-like protein